MSLVMVLRPVSAVETAVGAREVGSASVPVVLLEDARVVYVIGRFGVVIFNRLALAIETEVVFVVFVV